MSDPSPTSKPIYALGVLQALGVEFSLDYDDALDFKIPIQIGAESVRDLILKHEDFLVREVKEQARRDRQRYHGGPYDGCHAPHTLKGELSVLRMKRGRWAVYRTIDWDGRAFFQGYATTYAKGRRGQLVSGTL